MMTEEKINAISNNIRKQKVAAKKEKEKAKATKVSFDFSGGTHHTVRELSHFILTSNANRDLTYVEASEETDNAI